MYFKKINTFPLRLVRHSDGKEFLFEALYPTMQFCISDEPSKCNVVVHARPLFEFNMYSRGLVKILLPGCEYGKKIIITDMHKYDVYCELGSFDLVGKGFIAIESRPVITDGMEDVFCLFMKKCPEGVVEIDIMPEC